MHDMYFVFFSPSFCFVCEGIFAHQWRFGGSFDLRYPFPFLGGRVFGARARRKGYRDG